MTHLPASSIPTRLDASQGTQFPPNASFDSASVHPTMYQTPGLSCLPSTLLPIHTLPGPPFPATLYGAGGTSPMPNYQDQDTISLAANPIPNSTFVPGPLLSQDIHGADGSSSLLIYHGQGSVYPAENFTPNPTLVAGPLLSQDIHGADGSPSLPNYHGQGNVYPAANFIPNPTFVAGPLPPQDMYNASGSSSLPNYHGQDNVYPAANFIPNPTFVAGPLAPQDKYSASGSSSLPNYHGQGNVCPVENFIPNPIFVAHPSLSHGLDSMNGAFSVPDYYGQDNIPPPADLNPTSTFVAQPSLTQQMCSGGDTSNYQVPNGAIFPPTNVTLPMFPMNTQESCQPLIGMLPSDANPAFLQSEGSGSHDYTAPPIPQWALPMEAPVTAAGQQTMYQVPQSAVQREPPKEPVSAHKQIDVTPNGDSSARQTSSKRDQWKDLPGFQLRVKNKRPKIRRTAMPTMNDNDRERYYCDLCEKWVLVHRKKYHNKKHSAGKFACKICEILDEPCEPLSRKDALKRHIEVKHAVFSRLLRSCSLKLLAPRREDESEDLKPLLQAMIKIVS